MPPARKDSPVGNTEALDRLIDAVEDVAGQLEVLRQVLNEFREEFQWAVRNDPLAPNWSERLNRRKPEDLPANLLPPPSPTGSAQQRDLFERQDSLPLRWDLHAAVAGAVLIESRQQSLPLVHVAAQVH